MTHYIIVKFTDTVHDKGELIRQITHHFAPAADIPGIRQVQIFTSCIDRANRHDLMIKMDLEEEALDVFDASEIHRGWKENFGRYLETKTIFDCESKIGEI